MCELGIVYWILQELQCYYWRWGRICGHCDSYLGSC